MNKLKLSEKSRVCARTALPLSRHPQQMPYPHNIALRYFRVCCAYGFVQALPRVYDSKHEYHHNKPVDNLNVDKLAHCVQTALVAPLAWPVLVYQDARALELFARGLRREDYPHSEFP